MKELSNPFVRRAAIAAVLTLAFGQIGFAQEVSSPDGELVVELSLDEGRLAYSVRHGDTVVLEDSPLGLETNLGSFAEGLTSSGTKTSRVDERYELPHGKVSEVHYVANELVTQYSTADGRELAVTFRVSDNDVAFRYQINGVDDERRVEVLSEATGFNFPGDATSFTTPQVEWGGGFAKSKPSYEEGYRLDAPIEADSWTGLGFTFPALFKLDDDGWVLLSETGVTGRYAGSRLSDPSDDGTYTIAFPEAEENGGIGSPTVHGSLPLETPWRTITFGETLAPIVETTIATDVVEPQYEPTTDYKPGRSTWSWILWQDGSMNEADQRAFIDLAGELGYEYILVDAWWDERVGREKIAELAEYAGERGVDLMLWYNSNGYWNDAFQTPRDIMHSTPDRQREMAWMQSVGIKGIKVDFFGGDKQTTMQLYEDILTDANQYGLMCNFHGCTLPRGWERMYPNHMTSEAVTASENLVFSQGFADNEARNSTIFPFIRNPVGAMDYGPVFLNERFNKNPDRGNVRRTTDAFQLATAITYQSPLQHFGLTPDNLDEPEFVLDFLKQVPAAWDETRYVDGYPGEFTVLARRDGEQWYVGATHAGEASRELTLSLPWLAGETLTLIGDSSQGLDAEQREVQVGEDGRVDVTLSPSGGAVLYQRP